MTTTVNSAIESIFWVCFGAIAYTYIVYAPIIWFLSRLFGRQIVPERPTRLPDVTLLIAAHDEQDVIEARIENALAMDYPRDLLEILVASDGSTDRTNEIIRRFASRGVKLLAIHPRAGKSNAINTAVPEARGEIIVFSDANTMLDAAALKNLVRWFSNDRIGAVCGRLVLTDPVTGRNADSLYWKYETFLKKCESRLGALLGSNGAIYAMRRSLYQPIPSNTLVDDFVIPLLAKRRTNCSIVYDRDATAREETPKDLSSEFHRRSRIGAGGFQSIVLLWPLLNPVRGWISVTFFSHKVLRWLCPFFMIGCLAINAVLLIDRPFFRWIGGAQVMFYVSSLVVAWLPARARLLKPLRLTTMFTMMNAALFVGFFRWLRLLRPSTSASGAWQRTTR